MGAITVYLYLITPSMGIVYVYLQCVEDIQNITVKLLKINIFMYEITKYLHGSTKSNSEIQTIFEIVISNSNNFCQ